MVKKSQSNLSCPSLHAAWQKKNRISGDLFVLKKSVDSNDHAFSDKLAIYSGQHRKARGQSFISTNAFTSKLFLVWVINMYRFGSGLQRKRSP